jgi:hypothetical protein
MRTDPQSLVLFAGGCLFLLYLVVRMMVLRRGRSAATAAAHAQITQAKRRAADQALPVTERAAALRQAALVALESLRRPGLAASYARRAERLDPQAAESTTLLAAALRQGGKYRALERMLWRRMSQQEKSSAEFVKALGELLSLYEGPLHRPEVAAALRKMTNSGIS